MPEAKKNVRTIDITPDWLPLTKWYMRLLKEKGVDAKRKALAEEHMLDMAEKLDRLNKQVKDGDIVILDRKEYADLLDNQRGTL